MLNLHKSYFPNITVPEEMSGYQHVKISGDEYEMLPFFLRDF